MNEFIEVEAFIFGTKVYQKICTDNFNKEQVHTIFNKANEIMLDFENRLSFYKNDSEIGKINEKSGKSYVKVSEDTFEIIEKAKYYSEKTHGLFDITIAPLVKEWGINTYNPKIIQEDKVLEILKLVNYKDILLKTETREVMLSKENQKIDLGGIAKGYIADKIIDFYKSKKVKSAIINIGGNIKVLGSKDNSEPWGVGIYKPKKHSQDIIAKIKIQDESVVTSGDYERAFKYEGKLYNHILNPLTGYPANTDLKSITIVSKDSIKGDALATPLFIMGKYKAYEFMKKYNISGILVTNEDEIIISKDLISKFSLFENYKVLSF